MVEDTNECDWQMPLLIEEGLSSAWPANHREVPGRVVLEDYWECPMEGVPSVTPVHGREIIFISLALKQLWNLWEELKSVA